MLDEIDLLRAYRRSLRGARIGSKLALEQHHDTMRRERERRRRERLVAREALLRERERTAYLLEDYKRTFAQAQAEAKEYQAILERAKEEGRYLLRILELLRKRAA
ncbi:MAG: hypothetical protein QN152_01020 [Armatimonadota bacterium]|nr:hypothetical protein [Armatimonadota bacterium]MDR7426573.1 hypothetical protein [Armatimonadota bacterium]MDR7463672.1 hypothetical protein [Armatimonadota bacterium]MDR7468593.1 hypothetical protein [Armatimonadota bacterium]MDR7475991.1 hypothetical protein [Armatimonadota bacterium]